jgi:DDE superfamily endonuclease.
MIYLQGSTLIELKFMINTNSSSKIFIARMRQQKQLSQNRSKERNEADRSSDLAERDALVTMAVAVSRRWNSVLPFSIFRPKNYRNYFITRGPDDSAGFANKSGWMTGNNFVPCTELFTKSTSVTKGTPVLILLESDQLHLDIKFLDIAKEKWRSDVISTSYLSHVQPLDSSVYGRFNKFVNSASKAGIRSNPGRL